jgi:hypothetical protein
MCFWSAGTQMATCWQSWTRVESWDLMVSMLCMDALGVACLLQLCIALTVLATMAADDMLLDKVTTRLLTSIHDLSAAELHSMVSCHRSFVAQCQPAIVHAESRVYQTCRSHCCRLAGDFIGGAVLTISGACGGMALMIGTRCGERSATK